MVADQRNPSPTRRPPATCHCRRLMQERCQRKCALMERARPGSPSAIKCTAQERKARGPKCRQSRRRNNPSEHENSFDGRDRPGIVLTSVVSIRRRDRSRRPRKLTRLHRQANQRHRKPFKAVLGPEPPHHAAPLRQQPPGGWLPDAYAVVDGRLSCTRLIGPKVSIPLGHIELATVVMAALGRQPAAGTAGRCHVCSRQLHNANATC